MLAQNWAPGVPYSDSSRKTIVVTPILSQIGAMAAHFMDNSCFLLFLLSLWLRIGPRECHIRIPREKLYRIHKFSSKAVPREPVSRAFHSSLYIVLYIYVFLCKTYQTNQKHELFMTWAAVAPIWTRIGVPSIVFREESEYDTPRAQLSAKTTNIGKTH